MNEYHPVHGLHIFCKTCNASARDQDLLLIDGECEPCHDAYQDSIHTDKVGVNVWVDVDDDAVS